MIHLRIIVFYLDFRNFFESISPWKSFFFFLINEMYTTPVSGDLCFSWFCNSFCFQLDIILHYIQLFFFLTG